MRKALLVVLVVAFFVGTTIIPSYADSWVGYGPITMMYVYPTYALVVQGPVTSANSGCATTGSWVVVWDDFNQETKARIMSMLLGAYLSGKGIQVAVSSGNCYVPEGNIKRFSGQFFLG